MKILIKQVQSNYQNNFEIIEQEQGNVLFKANAPWMNINAPFHVENIRKLKFTDAQGNLIYTTRYHIIENMIEQAIPYKYLVTKEQKYSQYEIMKNDEKAGAFFTLVNGYLDSKFCIEYGQRVFVGFDIGKGKFQAVSVYDGETQIAQITKPLSVKNNLDIYYLHLKDEYAYLLPLLSFFTIYYDYLYYNNSGAITTNYTTISYSSSTHKNIDKYNPDWIAQNFGWEEAERIQNEIQRQRDAASANMKEIVKIMKVCFFIVVPIVLVIALIVIGIILWVLWKNGWL